MFLFRRVVSAASKITWSISSAVLQHEHQHKTEISCHLPVSVFCLMFDLEMPERTVIVTHVASML